MTTATLTYSDLMVALLEASYKKDSMNFYRGRKLILSAKHMLNLDEAILLQANDRRWEFDQLQNWVLSDEGYFAALNWISEGGNGFTTFFDKIKVGA
jgi:hypothetical protein